MTKKKKMKKMMMMTRQHRDGHGDEAVAAGRSDDDVVVDDDDVDGDDVDVEISERDRQKALRVLQELVDFQAEVFAYKSSLAAAEEFVITKPEALLSRLVSHLKYLFEIPSLEAMLARMNQVYLFMEEMKNFLAVMRDVLQAHGDVTPQKIASDSGVVAEIQKIVIRALAPGR